MTITLEQFKKFADDNDIMWFYNRPVWKTVRGRRIFPKINLNNLRFHDDVQREFFNKKELQMDESRESKHIIISNFTDNLEDAANDLQKLVNCVRGEPTVEEKGEKIKRDHGATSLSAFLDEHPKRIGELTGKITEATNQLKALLY